MRTDRLRINQLSPKTYQWYLAYLQAVDTKNVEAYGTFLADDCVKQPNNNRTYANCSFKHQVQEQGGQCPPYMQSFCVSPEQEDCSG